MSLRIKIYRDISGTWSVDGLLPASVSNLPSLSASIDYARKVCDAAPGTIERYVDGVYIVAHQERGLPKALVSGGTGQSHLVRERLDRHGATPWTRLVTWLRGSRRLAAEASAACLREHEVPNVVNLTLV